MQGEVQITSVEGLHQIHLFIFVLATVHVCYSCATVLLSLLQVTLKVSDSDSSLCIWFPYSAFYVILSHNAQHPEGSKFFSLVLSTVL